MTVKYNPHSMRTISAFNEGDLIFIKKDPGLALYFPGQSHSDIVILLCSKRYLSREEFDRKNMIPYIETWIYTYRNIGHTWIKLPLKTGNIVEQELQSILIERNYRVISKKIPNKC